MESFQSFRLEFNYLMSNYSFKLACGGIHNFIIYKLKLSDINFIIDTC